MFREVEIREMTFQPTAVGSDQTKALFNIKKGERVLAASARASIAAASSTDTSMILGDGTDTNGYIEAIDLETTAAGTLVNGAGTLLAFSGGKLYTADDTVDVIYAGSTYGATNPKYVFKIAVVQEWD
jgi:hypothetical protein